MAASTISRAFVTQFGNDVHQIFQRRGSLILETVRREIFMPGEKARFYKMAESSAKQKNRHGEIPPINAADGYVDLTMEDWYALDYIDRLDENKITIDKRMALARSHAMALGRKADEILRDKAYEAVAGDFVSNGGFTKYSSSTAQTVNLDLPIALRETVAAANVPFEAGEVTAIVGNKTWSELLGITQFVDADTIGNLAPDMMPLVSGRGAKRFLGINWVEWEGIGLDGSNDERNLLFHREAVGYGSRGTDEVGGNPLNPDFDWIGNRQAWAVTHSMEAGAATIDNTGAWEWVADVTP